MFLPYNISISLQSLLSFINDRWEKQRYVFGEALDPTGVLYNVNRIARPTVYNKNKCIIK